MVRPVNILLTVALLLPGPPVTVCFHIFRPSTPSRPDAGPLARMHLRGWEAMTVRETRRMCFGVVSVWTHGLGYSILE